MEVVIVDLFEKFSKIISEKDVQKQVEMIEALDGQDAKDILKAYVRFIGRPDNPIFEPGIPE